MTTAGCRAAGAVLKAGQEALLAPGKGCGSRLRKPVTASQAGRLPPLSLPTDIDPVQRRPVANEVSIDAETKIESSKALSGKGFREFRSFRSDSGNAGTIPKIQIV